jgi:hypothetical protein
LRWTSSSWALHSLRQPAHAMSLVKSSQNYFHYSNQAGQSHWNRKWKFSRHWTVPPCGSLRTQLTWTSRWLW